MARNPVTNIARYDEEDDSVEFYFLAAKPLQEIFLTLSLSPQGYLTAGKVQTLTKSLSCGSSHRYSGLTKSSVQFFFS